MIKRIELINFMSHAHTVIEPAEGLTVLIGPNNCGKSAIVTALQILAHNDNSTYVRRHGTKKTEVIVETDDGHTIKWSRAKNGSPKYEINGQLFDRLKKSGTPEILQQTLRLSKVSSEKEEFDIHFGQQKEPVFLLNDSGKAAAQFFASSSDASHLVEMQRLHKTKVRQARHEQQRLKDESAILDQEIDTLKQVETVDEKLRACEKTHVQLLEQDAQSNQLDLLLNQIADMTNQRQYRQQLLLILKQLEPVPELEPTDVLEALIDTIQKRQQSESFSRQTIQQLKTLPQVPTLEDEAQLSELVKQLEYFYYNQSILVQQKQLLDSLAEVPETMATESLESTIGLLERTAVDAKRQDAELKDVLEQLEAVKQNVSGWAEANPKCPTCGAKTNTENLLSAGSQCHE